MWVAVRFGRFDGEISFVQASSLSSSLTHTHTHTHRASRHIVTIINKTELPLPPGGRVWHEKWNRDSGIERQRTSHGMNTAFLFLVVFRMILRRHGHNRNHTQSRGYTPPPLPTPYLTYPLPPKRWEVDSTTKLPPQILVHGSPRPRHGHVECNARRRDVETTFQNCCPWKLNKEVEKRGGMAQRKRGDCDVELSSGVLSLLWHCSMTRSYLSQTVGMDCCSVAVVVSGDALRG